MFCKFCGSKITDDAIFCEKCGKRLIPEDENLSENIRPGSENDSKINNSESIKKTIKTDVPLKPKRKNNFQLMKKLLIASIVLCIFQGIITAKSFVDLSKYQRMAAGMRYTSSTSWEQKMLYGPSPSDIANKRTVATAWDRVYFAQAAVKRNCILLTIFLAFLVAIVISYNRSKKILNE